MSFMPTKRSCGVHLESQPFEVYRLFSHTVDEALDLGVLSLIFAPLKGIITLLWDFQLPATSFSLRMYLLGLASLILCSQDLFLQSQTPANSLTVFCECPLQSQTFSNIFWKSSVNASSLTSLFPQLALTAGISVFVSFNTRSLASLSKHSRMTHPASAYLPFPGENAA